MLVSSALYNSLESIFIPNGKLLMYSKNSNGPRMEPWGTPTLLQPTKLTASVPNLTSAYVIYRINANITVTHKTDRFNANITTAYTTHRFNANKTAAYTTYRLNANITAAYTTNRFNANIPSAYTTHKFNANITAAYTTHRLNTNISVAHHLNISFASSTQQMSLPLLSVPPSTPVF